MPVVVAKCTGMLHKQNWKCWPNNVFPFGWDFGEGDGGGGLTLFRSPFLNILSVLGLVFQTFCPLKVPFLSVYPF